MSAEQHAAHAAATDLDAIERLWANMEVTGFVPARIAITDVTAVCAEAKALRYEQERLRRDLAAARAALEGLVWVTNTSGETFCDYCGQGPDESGREGCSCAPLRAALGRAEEDR